MDDPSDECVLALYKDISDKLEECLMIYRNEIPKTEKVVPNQSNEINLSGDLSLALNCLKVQHDWNMRHQENLQDLTQIVSKSIMGTRNYSQINEAVKHVQALIDRFEDLTVTQIKENLHNILNMLTG